MKLDREFLRNFFLYGIIGGVSASVDVALFMVLHNVFGTNVFITNIFTTLCGITLSFFLNSKYNFRKTDRLLFRAVSFYLTGGFGLLLSSGLLWLGALLGISTNIVKISSVFIVAVIQFTLNKLIAFRSLKRPPNNNH